MADNAQSIIDTAVASADPAELDPAKVYSVVVPNGGSVRVLDTDRFLSSPRRKEGAVALLDAESFAAYVNRHETDDSLLYADPVHHTVTAVLNDHGTGAGWRDHRAVLALARTTAWERWRSRSGLVGEQEKFAEHIEDSMADIAEPPAADLLELAQSFQATTKASFAQGMKLANGQRQFAYEETVDAKAGEKGRLTIPAEFLVVVAPFEGAEASTIAARLRYRLREGTLSIGYVLDRPEDFERAAFDATLAAIRVNTTATVLLGTP